MIVIVDSGGANIGSIINALTRLGKTAKLTSDKNQIAAASHIILPGVGAAGHAMNKLHTLKLIETLRCLTQPVLGICLGMQLLFTHSAESDVDCLNIISGKVEKFSPELPLTIPHMGWNTVTVTNNSPLFAGIAPDSYFYFVHSYLVAVNAMSIATTVYGQTFSAAVQWQNYYGVQFHPERSGVIGAKLLANFLKL